MTPETRILIVGAGGFAREVFWWMQTHSDRSWAQQFGGFLDDNPTVLDPFRDYAPGIIDSILGYTPSINDLLVMAIADPPIKLRLAEKLCAKGARFTTFIHSDAVIVPNATIGVGCVICPRARVSCDVRIGGFVTINAHSGVGHDATIGDGCTLSAYCDVTGNAKLGRGVFMGSHSAVLPSVSVGDYAKIGAGSVVIRKVKPETIMMGVPASRVDFPQQPVASPQQT